MCYQCFYVFVKNLFFEVSQTFELIKNMIQINVVQIKTQLLDPFSKSKTTGMLTHHQIAGLDAY